MSLSTKGFKLVCHYPDHLRARVELFGIDYPDVGVSRSKGLLQLRCNSWVLPFAGLAIALEPETHV